MINSIIENLGLLVFCCGLLIAIYNYWAFLTGFIPGSKRTRTMVPLVGPVMMTLGAYLSQMDVLTNHIELFWLLDLGGLPTFVWIAFITIYSCLKSSS